MSVSPFDMNRLNKLYGQLLALNRDSSMFRAAFYTYAERLQMGQFNLVPELEIIPDLARLIRNLYLSNQLAYNLTYDGTEASWRLNNIQDLCMISQPQWTMGDLKQHYSQLYLELGNVQYNTVSNGGTCFLPHEDDMRIDRIKAYIAHLIVELIEEDHRAGEGQ